MSNGAGAARPQERPGDGDGPGCPGKKTLIEQAYTLGSQFGLEVWCEDEAGPFQTLPYGSESWQPAGLPAQQAHEYVRNGTAKVLTLLRPSDGQVRIKGVTSCTNAVLHPWLKQELTAILAALPATEVPIPSAQHHAAWSRWQDGLRVKFTLREELPPLRVLLVLDNLAGHTTPEFVCWCMDHGIMLLYTPLSGSWLNMAVSGVATLTSLVAAPIAVLLSLATVRPIVRHVRVIAETSCAFAAGDMAARTGLRAVDELGALGQQFDQMAATISRQIGELRSFAAENTRLSTLVEQSARQAERATFARDLHDTISQHLFSLSMGTAHLADLIGRDPQRASQQAAQLAVMAEEAQHALRTILAQLRPADITGRSLTEALDAYMQRWQARSGVRAHLRLQLDVASIPIAVEDVMFRVCQESLNNAARHARAQQIVITLRQDARQVQLVIADDGGGFDPAMPSSGVGVIGMHERVRAVGGTLTVQSSRDAGTTIAVCVPIAPRAMEGRPRANHAAAGG